VISLVPWLLGFQPGHADLVVIGTAPPRGRVTLTWRWDLPDPPTPVLAVQARHAVHVDGQLPVVIFHLIARPAVLVLEAWDQASTPLVMRQVDIWEESGRGLFLVNTLAARWSWKTAPDWPGKCVRAELREPSQPLAGEG
jgi:hypothetical protein